MCKCNGSIMHTSLLEVSARFPIKTLYLRVSFGYDCSPFKMSWKRKENSMTNVKELSSCGQNLLVPVGLLFWKFSQESWSYHHKKGWTFWRNVDSGRRHISVALNIQSHNAVFLTIENLSEEKVMANSLAWHGCYYGKEITINCTIIILISFIFLATPESFPTAM